MIPSVDGDTAICIGTVFHKFGEKEPSQGRLLLFEMELDTRLSNHKRQLNQISELNVKGCVYALARANGLLVAAVGPSVGFFLLGFFRILIYGRSLYTKLTAQASKKSRIGTTTT